MKKFGFTILKALLFVIGWALLVSVLTAPKNENPVVWRFWAELLPLLCTAAVSYCYWLAEKRKICIFPSSNLIKNSVTGMAGGVIWVGIPFLIMAAIGAFRITGYINVKGLWLWLVSVLLNTIMQELLVRGYLYQMIRANYNVLAAACVSLALFTVLHGGAFEAGLIPVCNVLTMSILMTIVLEGTKSLITPIMMHFVWNGIGAVILGGVSLAEDYPHVFTGVFEGSEILTGGNCKMEGSIIVFFINILMMIGLLIYYRRSVYKSM